MSEWENPMEDLRDARKRMLEADVPNFSSIRMRCSLHDGHVMHTVTEYEEHIHEAHDGKTIAVLWEYEEKPVKKRVKKVALEMTDEIHETVKSHADAQDVTVQEFIRRAISTRVDLEDAQDEGYTILLERTTGFMGRIRKEYLLRR